MIKASRESAGAPDPGLTLCHNTRGRTRALDIMRERSDFPSIVFRHRPNFVYFLVVVSLAMNVVSLAQTAAAPAKSVEQSALQHGQEALQSGDIARARAEFEKAVHLAPNDAEAQSALGWVLAQQGEADAALAHLRAAIKSKPGLVEPRLTLAGVLAQPSPERRDLAVALG